MQIGEHGYLKIHFFYVCLLLSLTIIVLVSFNWTSLEGFTDYLSVAATLTSLVLGLLAIIYSFFSSGSINQSLGSLEDASRQMRLVAQDFKVLASDSSNIQQKAENRTERLHDLIENMQGALDKLASTTQSLAGSVDTLPERITNAQKSAEPVNLTSVESGSSRSEDRVTLFLNRISPLGLVAVYAGLKAYEAGRYVDFEKLVGERSVDYIWGFLVAASSADIFAMDYMNKKLGARVSRMKDPDEKLSLAIEAAWESAPRHERRARRGVVEKYGAIIDDALVDAKPES